MLSGILEKIGLNKKESLVYLALLELGSQPASTIGKKAEINRSTTYLVLDSLMKRGLVNQYVRADVKYFTAADPQTIVDGMKQEAKKIDRTHRELNDLLPEFYALRNPLSIKPKVKFYDGETGVKRAMEDTLTASESLLSWDAMESWLKSTPNLQKYIIEYAHLRAEKHRIPVKVLFMDTPLSRQYILKDYPARKKKKDPLLEFKWIPKDIQPFKNEINIYDDKVSIVSLAKNELFGVIIESHEIAKIHKAMFELAWRAGNKT
jgi:sugar-specific transcriptional regulator TrmB